jgi:hypothetical protein
LRSDDTLVKVSSIHPVFGEGPQYSFSIIRSCSSFFLENMVSQIQNRPHHLYPSIAIQWCHWFSLSTFPVPLRSPREPNTLQVLCVCDSLTKQHSRLSDVRRVSRSDKCQAQVHVGPDPPHRFREGIRLQGLSRFSSSVWSLPQHECAPCWWFFPWGQC